MGISKKGRHREGGKKKVICHLTNAFHGLSPQLLVVSRRRLGTALATTGAVAAQAGLPPIAGCSLRPGAAAVGESAVTISSAVLCLRSGTSRRAAATTSSGTTVATIPTSIHVCGGGSFINS